MTVMSDHAADFSTGSTSKTTEPETPTLTVNPLAAHPGVVGVPTVIVGAIGLALA